MEQPYAAIGRAVVFAQIFEAVLISIFELFEMQTVLGYIEKNGGYIPNRAFKVPVKNIIKALSAKSAIAPDLEARLNQYVEDRNVLIHRWVLENGWPDNNDAADFAPIIVLANRVEHEAKELSCAFAGYMTKFAEPEWAAASAGAYKARMAAIFHRGHT